jgi:hypothetical protein
MQRASTYVNSEPSVEHYSYNLKKELALVSIIFGIDKQT